MTENGRGCVKTQMDDISGVLEPLPALRSDVVGRSMRSISEQTVKSRDQVAFSHSLGQKETSVKAASA